jgi:hypothetical protein
MQINWLLVWKPDGETDAQVYPYEDESQAREHYEYKKQAWTDVFLCKVIIGPD